MGYDLAIDAPFHTQWEPSSRLPTPDPGTAPNNCGPTSVTNIAHYYRDERYGVYATRRLAVSGYGPTSISDQQSMLKARGVDCYFAQLDMSSIRFYGETGRWPIEMGLDMSKVPLEIAGHPFRGMHAVVRLQNDGYGYGLIRDPNFSELTGRNDPTGGMRRYPDWVIKAAYVDVHGWALIPRKPKPEQTWQGRVRIDGPGHVIRDAPREQPSTVFAESHRDGYTYSRSGRKLWPNTYSYYWNGHIAENQGIRYYSVKTHGGDRRFIRVGAGVVTRKA